MSLFKKRSEILNLVYTRQADAVADHIHRLQLEVERLTNALKTCDRILNPLRQQAQKNNETK